MLSVLPLPGTWSGLLYWESLNSLNSRMILSVTGLGFTWNNAVKVYITCYSKSSCLTDTEPGEKHT